MRIQVSGPKLVNYRSQTGPRAGVVVGAWVLDWSDLVGRNSCATTLDVLQNWGDAASTLSLAALANSDATRWRLDEVSLLAPVLHPSAIYCAGANYADHMQEMAQMQNIPPDPDPHALGLKPWHFLKASGSIAGPNAEIALPPHSTRVDWEAELVVVIGRTAKNVPANRALEFVAGYTIANDLSARDLMQRPNLPATSPFKYDWIAQKCFDGSCPLGPWIVPAAEIPDPQNLSIQLWLNNILKQDSHTNKMIFSVAEQIEHLSNRITLHPGDLILTGTPAGVGVARGEFLKHGDVVRITIEQIGTLTNSFV